VTKETNGDGSRAPFFFSCRFMLAVVGFFMFMHLYAQRIGMSVAIVCMLNQTAVDELELLATENATKLVQHQPNGTEWSLNLTVHSSAKSVCNGQLDDGTVVHEVDSPCLLIVFFYFEVMLTR